jgi:hypothetical protein
MKLLAVLFVVAHPLATVLIPSRTSNFARDAKLSINPLLSFVHPIGDVAACEALPNINAERLARGLPLKKPSRAYKASEGYRILRVCQ